MLLGKGTNFQIEARPIFEGLCIAWEKEILQLEIESDNAFLMETIVEGRAVDSQTMELRSIHRMMHKGWNVCFRHIPRTHNAIVDHMTKVRAKRFHRGSSI